MICIANICVIAPTAPDACYRLIAHETRCPRDDRDRRRPDRNRPSPPADGPRPPALQVDRAVEHHSGNPAGLDQRLDRADLATGHLPRHRSQPAGSRQCQLSALDADGLPRGDRGAGGAVRQARRHVRPGADVQHRLRRVHPRRRRAVVRPVPSRRRGHLADRLAGDPGRC